MADTPRTLAQLLALAPDNTQGLISPQDLRDMLVSLFPSRGQIDLTISGSTTFALTNTYYPIVCTTAFDTALGQDGFVQSGNGLLQTTKAVNQVVLCTANLEMQCPANNKTFSVAFAKNGSPFETFHVSQKMSDSGSRYFFTVTGLIPTNQHDIISVQVRNDTDTTSITTYNLTVSAVGFIR